MPQEQYAQRSTMQSSEGPHVYKVGIYGWRKRCLYFFVLLLMILILVNLAMTIWILKVMNFTIVTLFIIPLNSFFSLGPKAVEAYSQKFQVLTTSGKLLFSADDNEVVVGAERLKVLGKQYSSELLLFLLGNIEGYELGCRIPLPFNSTSTSNSQNNIFRAFFP
uniref:Sarcoglycan delta n=1 Tax=Naja naja TaxID=35670 RepID=A0A8C6XFB1_NAJNA